MYGNKIVQDSTLKSVFPRELGNRNCIYLIYKTFILSDNIAKKYHEMFLLNVDFFFQGNFDALDFSSLSEAIGAYRKR